MSKKKRPGRQVPKRRGDRPSRSSPAPELSFDRRAMERTLSQLSAGLGGKRSNSALDLAQELVYKAFETDDPARRARLAREALSQSPDCADACVLLAEQATTAEEALALYEQGTAAGERALGKKFFQESAGHFWGLLETRPYMRARLGLADHLAITGQHDAAAEHYRELLRLNPNDNQGVRHVLAKSLLILNRDQELETVLESFADDCMAAGSYCRALVAFRLHGDSSTARERLQLAHRWNRHVPGYLLGHEELPAQTPAMVALGSAEEAAAYAVEYRGTWRETPGAMAWLRKVLDLPAVTASRAAGPKPNLSLDRLRALELRRDETWQVFIQTADERAEPSWSVMILSSHCDSPLAIKPLADADDAMWEVLAKCMRRPPDHDPRRPGVVEYASQAAVPPWAERLRKIGVECRASDEMRVATEMLTGGQAPRERPILTGDVAALPQRPGEAWQIGCCRFPGWFHDHDGTPQRAWVSLVVDRESRFILPTQITQDEPTHDWLAEATARAMMAPGHGPAHRPAVVQVGSPEQAAALRQRFSAWGVAVEVDAELGVWREAFAKLADDLVDHESLRGMVEVPGMRIEQVAGFYEAAADFYRRAPWRLAPGDTPFRIECPRFDTRTWYGFVMGQLGMTLGLALYEDLATLKKLLSGQVSNEEHQRQMSGISLTFDEAFETPIRDVNAAEEHGWPIAAPEAYPCVIRIEHGMAPRPPLSWELLLLEGCLRAVPDFVGRKEKGPFSVTVKAGGEELPFAISWRLE